MTKYHRYMKTLYVSLIVFLGMSICAVFLVWRYLGPYGGVTDAVFVVPMQSSSFDVPGALAKQKLIKHEQAFRFLYHVRVSGKTTPPGGYRLNSSMHAWQIISKLTSPPDFVWVTIREGLRKEQIGLRLQDALGWSDTEVLQWNTTYADSREYREGVYFPDTYLLPVDETPGQIAQRFIAHFNEKLAPYMTMFSEKNIQWTTGITIASLIERETNSQQDMPVIAAVIWNRLEQGMRLQIDATVQYALGNEKDGWWPIVKGSDTRTTDSPYNTYLHDGLPPGPIANPGLSAIVSAANPADSTCLFYLHSNNVMYCADTYEEHLENIRMYLQ